MLTPPIDTPLYGLPPLPPHTNPSPLPTKTPKQYVKFAPKANNKDIRKTSVRRSSYYVINCEHISLIVLMFLSLTLNK